MPGLLQRLRALPQEPVSASHPKHWVFRTKRGLDFVGHATPQSSRFWRKANPYPKPWKHVVLYAEDGVDVAAWYGPSPRKDAPFGLVIVPGMFSTKDDTIHKRRAIRAWRLWKIPVCIIDMRAFGESRGIATGGWKEAYDVLAAGRYLRDKAGVERVGVLAESMGGAATLNALAHDGESGQHLFDGGVLCWSAFVDVKDAVDHISSRPPKDDPFRVQWEGFRKLLRMRSHGGYERFDEYMEDAARVNGLADFAELATLANPKWKTRMMRSPTLLVHAMDDPVVPVRHARRMDRYAADLEHIQVLLTTWGKHTLFEGMDEWWFWEVNRLFFGEVNGCELPNPAGSRQSL